MINLKHLYYFYLFSKELNMTKTAARLFITVPALSNQLKDLEKRIGYKLYSRESGKTELTEKGKIIADYTERIFAAYEELSSEVNRNERKETFA
jgi:DNA-binding transcriptional LysR family regulator